MTLDRSCNPTIKGHLCSLLVSNILLNPLFLLSTSRYVPFDPKTLFTNFFNKNTVCFFCLLPFAKGESDFSAAIFTRSDLITPIFSHFYIMRNTAVYFFTPIGSLFSFRRKSPFLIFHRTVPSFVKIF